MTPNDAFCYLSFYFSDGLVFEQGWSPYSANCMSMGCHFSERHAFFKCLAFRWFGDGDFFLLTDSSNVKGCTARWGVTRSITWKMSLCQTCPHTLIHPMNLCKSATKKEDCMCWENGSFSYLHPLPLLLLLLLPQGLRWSLIMCVIGLSCRGDDDVIAHCWIWDEENERELWSSKISCKKGQVVLNPSCDIGLEKRNSEEEWSEGMRHLTVCVQLWLSVFMIRFCVNLPSSFPSWNQKLWMEFPRLCNLPLQYLPLEWHFGLYNHFWLELEKPLNRFSKELSCLTIAWFGDGYVFTVSGFPEKGPSEIDFFNGFICPFDPFLSIYIYWNNVCLCVLGIRWVVTVLWTEVNLREAGKSHNTPMNCNAYHPNERQEENSNS